MWNKRVAIAAPRSFAKSTIFSVIYPLWSILYWKKNIILVSATGTLAESMLRKLKRELDENQAIIADFGNVQSKKWTEDNIILKNGSEVQAKGAGYQVRGFRPQIIICDDLEEDEQVRSADRREKLEDWFWSALINSLEPDQQLLIVGTLLHPQSFLKKLVDKPPKNWYGKTYKAYKEDGEPLWVEKWSREKLEDRRAEIGEARFQKEFMNNPLANADTVFKVEWIEPYYVDKLPERKELDVLTAVDPAISKKDIADYTAIITVGIHKETKHVYVLEVKAGRWSVYETVNEINATYQAWHPRSILIEEVQYQAALRQVLLKETRDKGFYLPVRQVQADADKVRRASNVSHFLEQGIVHMMPHHEDFVEQLVSFPGGDHDDMVDAFVYALTAVMTGVARVSRPERAIQRDKPSIFQDIDIKHAMKHKIRKAWF